MSYDIPRILFNFLTANRRAYYISLMWKAPQDPAAEPQLSPPSMTSSNTDDPFLTPQFCFATSALKEFLRLSRSTTDDTISQHLSSLSPPPTFNPHTTSQRTPSHRLIPPTTLTTFLSSTIYPTWSKRSEVLTYCAIVATSPDPNDPNTDLISKESEKDRMRIVDERLDPYSGRFFPTESRTQVLAGVVRNERGVEEIVRERTWEVIKTRSTDGMGGKTWQEAYAEWKTPS